MAYCEYCGTQIDNGAKFCTACGAKVPAAPEAPAVPASPVQDNCTAPAENYTPVQQPAPEVPVSSSAPQQNYVPGAAKQPKAPAGKKRLLTFGGIALAVILLIALVSSCGGGGSAADDPNLGIYNAVSAEMWGMEIAVSDMFENGVSIELMPKGKCEMNFDGVSGKGDWTLEDGAFYAEARGAVLEGTLSEGILVAENVMDMGVNLIFEKEGGFVPLPEEQQDSASEDISAVLPESAEVTELQKQWNGTWFGTMYVYEAEGDFAGIPTDDVYDCYMVVDVDGEGTGTFEVYFDGVDEPFAVAECTAYDYGMDAVSGSIVDMADMNVRNWMFRPVPDFPDRYTVTDTIEYDDSLFSFSVFFKQWGKSWQDEIDTDFEIVPFFVDDYEAAIANGELPPVGFAPIDYAAAATEAPAEEAAEEAAQAPAAQGMSGTFSFTIEEFMTDSQATFSYELPEAGWVTDVYGTDTVYIYNVPSLSEAHSACPRIQFTLKQNMEKLDFYKDQFENLKDVDSRVISGIEFKGRNYVQHNMEWTEYYGELPNGVWLSCKISRVDFGDGTEAAAILDSVVIS